MGFGFHSIQLIGNGILNVLIMCIELLSIGKSFEEYSARVNEKGLLSEEILELECEFCANVNRDGKYGCKSGNASFEPLEDEVGTAFILSTILMDELVVLCNALFGK